MALLLETIGRSAVIAGRLMLCPGDDILMATAGAAKTLESGEAQPVVMPYDRNPVLRIKKTDRKGNELLEEVPDEFEEVILVEFPNWEQEMAAADYFPQELELRAA